jgi:ABC-type antimicrobial peptide transport system permease subunit
MLSAMTATFGTLATLLAVVGLYGVMSYTVSRRRREIGVRVVFGASAGNIRWLVIREVLVIAATGIALALPGGWHGTSRRSSMASSPPIRSRLLARQCC